MKLTLNVQGSQLDDEVKELLKTLTQEQLSELALQAVTATLKDSSAKMNLSVAEGAALKELKDNRKDASSITIEALKSNRYLNQYRIRDDFNELVKKHANIRTTFEEQIVKKMFEHAEKHIEESVQNNDIIQSAIKEASNQIKNKFPEIVQNAMVMYFASQMEKMMQVVASNMMGTTANSNLLSDIQKALAEASIPMNQSSY